MRPRVDATGVVAAPVAQPVVRALRFEASGATQTVAVTRLASLWHPGDFGTQPLLGLGTGAENRRPLWQTQDLVMRGLTLHAHGHPQPAALEPGKGDDL